MKKLLTFALFFNIFISSSYANIDDKINKDLNKSFKKYEKEISRIQKKILNLKKNQSKDVQKIDQSLKELDVILEFSKQNLRASNGLKPKIKKIKPPATNVRKIANTGVKKKIALDG